MREGMGRFWESCDKRWPEIQEITREGNQAIKVSGGMTVQTSIKRVVQPVFG